MNFRKAGEKGLLLPASARPRKPTLKERVAAIPVMRPREMEKRLEALGYRGQVEARRAVALYAYRHVSRLRMLHLEGVPREEVPPAPRLLLLGPTGCGKTHLVELLFGKILGLPAVVEDMTTFSETGYWGGDVEEIFTRLGREAKGDSDWAGCGVVCMDEFDKLASGTLTNRTGGGGTKDVSGYGVQRGLLRMLDGAEVRAPVSEETIFSKGPKVRQSTADILFVASGAFSGLRLAHAGLREGERIGFGREASPSGERIAEDVPPDVTENLETFRAYGFMPELIGRFTRIVALKPLDRATLSTILRDNVLPRYRRELDALGIRINVPDLVLDHFAQEAERRETGARGIQTALSAALEVASFEAFSSRPPGTIHMALDDGRVRASWEPKAAEVVVPVADGPAAGGPDMDRKEAFGGWVRVSG